MIIDNEWSLFSAQIQHILKSYDFDEHHFDRVKQWIREKSIQNECQDRVEVLLNRELIAYPDVVSSLYREAFRVGYEAIQRGEVGIVLLNGGMATRFGGGVKGIAEVVPNTSFLGVKLLDAARYAGAVSVFLMNSFMTHDLTQEHLRENGYFGLSEQHVHCVCQPVSVRLTPLGDIFDFQTPEKALYSTGHADVLSAIGQSSAFQHFIEGGGRYLMVSNVDNVGALISPVCVGMHILGNKPITSEVVDKFANDRGGIPVSVNGVAQILESFRVPTSFNQDIVRIFNTNTFTINVDVFLQSYPLQWFRVEKSVNERAVVQFERLLGEITAYCATQFLHVPRLGTQGRFLPVKTKDDLKYIDAAIVDKICSISSRQVMYA